MWGSFCGRVLDLDKDGEGRTTPLLHCVPASAFEAILVSDGKLVQLALVSRAAIRTDDNRWLCHPANMRSEQADS